MITLEAGSMLGIRRAVRDPEDPVLGGLGRESENQWRGDNWGGEFVTDEGDSRREGLEGLGEDAGSLGGMVGAS
jgi:hypothetical protein